MEREPATMGGLFSCPCSVSAAGRARGRPRRHLPPACPDRGAADMAEIRPLIRPRATWIADTERTFLGGISVGGR